MPIGHRAAVPHGASPRCCRGARRSTELLRDRLFWPAWCGAGAIVRRRGRRRRRAGRRWSRSASAGSPPASALRQLVLATRRQGWRGLVGRANGGMIVHLGVIIIAVALGGVEQLHPRRRAHARRPAQPVDVAAGTRSSSSTSTVVHDARSSNGVTAPTCVLDGGQIVRAGDHDLPQLRQPMSARRACAPGSPRTSTSRSSRAPPPATRTAHDPGVRQAADRVAVDRRADDGGRHAARRRSPATAGAARSIRCRRRSPSSTDRSPTRRRRRRCRCEHDRRTRHEPGDDPTARSPARRRPCIVAGASRVVVAGLFVVLASAQDRAAGNRRVAAARQAGARRRPARSLDGVAVRPSAAQGQLGGAQLLHTRRACRASRSTPSWSQFADAAGGARPTAPSSTRSITRRHPTTQVDEVLRRARRRLAGRLRRRRLDRQSPSAWPQVPETWIIDPERRRAAPASISKVTAEQLDTILQQFREQYAG